VSSTGWRNLCFALGALCIAQLWRGCGATQELAAPPECPSISDRTTAEQPSAIRDRTRGEAEPPSSARAADDSAEGGGPFPFPTPTWARWLAPQPGEDLRTYRDRLLPLALAVVAPHRARVARSRNSFAELAHLDAHQRAELDDAAQEAAAALQDRVLDAVLSGELAPAAFKPMAGVSVARDLLEIVDRGNRRFVGALHDDQRAQLAQHPFDFSDYLVFSTRWEDALKLLD
jgi:hypothetical protein